MLRTRLLEGLYATRATSISGQTHHSMHPSDHGRSRGQHCQPGAIARARAGLTGSEPNAPNGFSAATIPSVAQTRHVVGAQRVVRCAHPRVHGHRLVTGLDLSALVDVEHSRVLHQASPRGTHARHQRTSSHRRRHHQREVLLGQHLLAHGLGRYQRTLGRRDDRVKQHLERDRPCRQAERLAHLGVQLAGVPPGSVNTAARPGCQGSTYKKLVEINPRTCGATITIATSGGAQASDQAGFIWRAGLTPRPVPGRGRAKWAQVL